MRSNKYLTILHKSSFARWIITMTYWPTDLLTCWITGHPNSCSNVPSPPPPNPPLEEWAESCCISRGTHWAWAQYSYTFGQWCVVIFSTPVQWLHLYIWLTAGKIVACPGNLIGMFFDLNLVWPEIYHLLWLESIVHTKYLINVSNIVST